jgi:phage shock protein A
MDFEQPKTPVMTNENVAVATDLRHIANALIVKKTKHQQTAQRLQSQLDGFAARDLQLRSNVQALQHTNTALAQEILRLRWTVDTLNGAMRTVCGHSQYHCQYYSRPLADVDEGVHQRE